MFVIKEIDKYPKMGYLQSRFLKRGNRSVPYWEKLNRKIYGQWEAMNFTKVKNFWRSPRVLCLWRGSFPMQGLILNQLSKRKLLRQQFGPGAAQCLLESDHGGYQDIDPACFDFLDRADVEVHKFGETFLRHGLSGSLSANVRSQLLQLPLDSQVTWHALLGRKSFLTVTAQWGVIGAAATEISL